MACDVLRDFSIRWIVTVKRIAGCVVGAWCKMVMEEGARVERRRGDPLAMGAARRQILMELGECRVWPFDWSEPSQNVPSASQRIRTSMPSVSPHIEQPASWDSYRRDVTVSLEVKSGYCNCSFDCLYLLFFFFSSFPLQCISSTYTTSSKRCATPVWMPWN